MTRADDLKAVAQSLIEVTMKTLAERGVALTLDDQVELLTKLRSHCEALAQLPPPAANGEKRRGRPPLAAAGN